MMMSESEGPAFASAISRILGWTYFILWSVSFYPQPIKNYRRRSTTGLSIDFPLTNLFGMVAYTISNGAFLLSPLIRSQYAARHHGQLPTVRVNDFVYALHGVALIIIVLSQFVPRLWGFQVAVSRKPSWTFLGICGASVILVFLSALLVWFWGGDGGRDPSRWAWIDVVNTCGWVKILLTVVKYMPQAALNFRRQSTVGWSITQVLLDFTGSILSLLQLVIDASLQGDWKGVINNPAKFALGNVSLLFDVTFMSQHYILYRGAKDVIESGSVLADDEETDIEPERRPLLEGQVR